MEKTNIDFYLEGNKRTSLLYWYPKVQKHCPHIPMPRTEILPVSQELLTPLLDGELTPEIQTIFAQARMTARIIGYPLFLRSDMYSGKHSWKRTCYVPDETSLAAHIQEVIEANEIADFFGLPYKALVFREFLELEAKFTAFWGEMPVAKERRYYVNNGVVLCHHPYWPPASIETPSVEDWEPLLEQLNQESPVEIQHLTHLTEMIGAVLDGYWSVDFAYATNGQWYLIDMADGYISYHWEGCDKKLAEVEG